MIRQATFLAVAVAALSGCATLVHGPYQDVMIDSNPPGAKATVTAQALGARAAVRRQGEADGDHARHRPAAA